MKHFTWYLGVLLIPVFTFLCVPDVYCQVPFNSIQTSHPIFGGDPNNVTYWCLDCHYFENNPTNDKWVKTEIELLAFHTAYAGSLGSTVNVYYPSGGDLVTDNCGQPGSQCGPCQVCHTQTLDAESNPVWRYDGTGQGHMGGIKDCLACHPHWNEVEGELAYMFSPSSGGTGPSHELHVSDTIKGPNMDCVACHGEYLPLFDDGQNLDNTIVCNQCHSPDGYFDGVDDPVVGAKPNWVSGDNPSLIYNATGTILNTGKENWCLGCHDEGTSQINGASAPPVAGDNVKYGYNISGHGKPGLDIKCETCHNLMIRHIDGQQRTYQASLDNYKVGYRLAMGMAIPRNAGEDTYETGAFQLCTYSCHDYGDLATGNLTGFRGSPAPDYCGQVQNYHDTHMNHISWMLVADSDFDGTVDSGQTCTNCHNVHGSRIRSDANPLAFAPNPVMVRDGRLANATPGFDFKYYKATDCGEPCQGRCPLGAQTLDFDLSRWGKFPDYTQFGNCGAECHYTAVTTLQYYRGGANITINRVWTVDPNTNQDSDSFAPGDDVRYKVEFSIPRPPASSYVITHPNQSKAQSTSGTSWSTKLSGGGTLQYGTHVWAQDTASPYYWDKIIPTTADPGSTAQVQIPLGMFTEPGGTLVDYDYGPIHTFDID